MSDHLQPMPAPKVEVPFGYQPRGPFTLTISPMTYQDDHRTLDSAIEAFARQAWPLDERIAGASVMDYDGVIVVGYLNLPDRMLFQAWYGIQAGFDALAKYAYIDPLELACAEIEARSKVPG